MAVYVRTKSNGEYHSYNFSHAVYGFREMGAEIIKYESVKEIYDCVNVDDIVLDYIDECQYIMGKFGVSPSCEDYPEQLKHFMGRRVWKDKINSINSNPDKWGVFVKPMKDKAFTGLVVNGPKDLIGCGSASENYDVLCSDVLNIKREWRCFITYDSVVDIRPYKGDYHYNYDPSVVDQIIDAFRMIPNRPMGCSVDIAVVEKDGKTETIFLEMNDGYALGNYGLQYLDYAKLISARWSQLLNRQDEFDFRR